MLLYRIGKTTHAHDLTGLGAKLHGGRWNHAGTPCIYLTENRALALLEYAAHTAIDLLPPSLSFTSFDVPAYSMRQLTANELPISWLQQPYSRDSQDIGSEWLAQKDCLLLKIPSVLIAREFNFVLNTMHPLISAVKIVQVADYTIPERLMQ
jgi:RES domain-containing protein